MYRRQNLKVSTRLKALDEIYKMYTYASLGEKNRIENEIMKMYTLLHRSAFKNSAKFRQTFSHFRKFTLKILFIFCNYVPKFTNVDVFRNVSNLYGKDQNLLDFSQISWDFATNIFEI